MIFHSDLFFTIIRIGLLLILNKLHLIRDYLTMIQLKFQNLEKNFVIALKFFGFIENDNNKKFMKIYRSFSLPF